ncbi:hypothetical protein GCM10022237_06300 [Nocardioides ginsengisoli]|uniref:Dihydrodipicolinate reductase n=1 Tax=Nocardioides ginsengisoli TaxID=363868 RepID=A0ABW3VWJ5_9ACTN
MGNTLSPAGVRLGLYGSGRTAAELVTALRSGPHSIEQGIVHAPRRAGSDLGELTIGAPIGVGTTSDLEAVLGSGKIELLLYAGLGGPRHIEAMALCAEYGVDMVHACFVHPRSSLPEPVYEALDAGARSTGSRIVGTGMIPGLWLDVLPCLLSSGLPAPVSVEASRVSDISAWGADVLAQELGVGSRREGTAVEPDRALRESARMIADVLGLGELEPESQGGLVAAGEDVIVGSLAVRRGQVLGFDQHVVLRQGESDRIRLSWRGLPGAGSAPGEKKAVEVTLTGADGSQILVQVSTPRDPYPGTAARMVSAVDGLQALGGGLHPTTALRIV